MDLHKVLKNSYASRKKQKNAFLKDGYRYDKFLSKPQKTRWFNRNGKIINCREMRRHILK